MKISLLLIFLLSGGFTGFAQYNPAVVGLKSGDSINGILGDVQRKVFKYKTQVDGKAKKLDFSEIAFVKILSSRKDIKIYRFFQLEEDKKYTPFLQLVEGKNAELYSSNLYMQSFGTAGQPMGYDVVKYYAKKPSEEKLTFLGIYDPIPNTLKGKVIRYINDCPELVKKIENKEFRMRNGLAPVFEFYNTSCKTLQTSP